MNQENLVASRGVPRLNVVHDLVGGGPSFAHGMDSWPPSHENLARSASRASECRDQLGKIESCRQKQSLVRVELLDYAARSEKFADRSTQYVEAHDEVILPNCWRGFAGMRPAKQV